MSTRTLEVDMHPATGKGIKAVGALILAALTVFVIGQVYLFLLALGNNTWGDFKAWAVNQAVAERLADHSVTPTIDSLSKALSACAIEQDRLRGSISRAQTELSVIE